MIKQELYNRTVDILVKAYFDDTLEHDNCYACAVGNLVAANQGLKFVRLSDSLKDIIWEGHLPYSADWVNDRKNKAIPHWIGLVGKRNHALFNKRRATLEVKSTGYTWQELSKIEYAFETAPKGDSEDEWMFNGLMAVIEILDQIHHNTDERVTKISKQRFVKTPCAK